MYEETIQAAWEGLNRYNEEIKKEEISAINVFFVLVFCLGVLIAFI